MFCLPGFNVKKEILACKSGKESTLIMPNYAKAILFLQLAALNGLFATWLFETIGSVPV